MNDKSNMVQGKAKEEMKYLRLYIEHVTQENSVLKEQIESQNETSKETKRSLSNVM